MNVYQQLFWALNRWSFAGYPDARSGVQLPGLFHLTLVEDRLEEQVFHGARK